MATEVTQHLVHYLLKVLPSVIDVAKIRLVWRRATHKPSVRLPGVDLSRRKMAFFCMVRGIPSRLQEVHCNALLHAVGLFYL